MTEQGLVNLLDRVQRMTSLDPSWASITWGAGGSTQQRSLMLADGVQKKANLQACLHLTCTNMERSKLDDTLQASAHDFKAWLRLTRINAGSKLKIWASRTFLRSEEILQEAKNTGLLPMTSSSMRSI